MMRVGSPPDEGSVSTLELGVLPGLSALALMMMVRPSGVDSRIDLSLLPLLDGAQECVAAGAVSSLQAANLRLRSALRNPDQFQAHPRYALLFDPQTAGGLLASVPGGQADACVAALHALGYARATIIGRVLPRGDAPGPITLVDG